MSQFRCPKCGSETFEASMDIICHVKGNLSLEEDGLMMVSQEQDLMSFECYQLMFAECGEHVELELTDLQFEGKEIFPVERILIGV